MTAGVPVLLRKVFTRDEAAELAWQDRALCPETDPELHFPETGEPSDPAKAVCRGCEVREPCLRYALGHREAYGVWGGFSEPERAAVHREHLAGTPLADIIAEDEARFYDRADERAARLAANEARRLAAARQKRAAAREAAA